VIARALVNFLLRRRYKPLWQKPVSVEKIRAFHAHADRLSVFGRRPTAYQPATVGGVAVEWIGPQDAARDGVLVYLHGGGFAVHAMLGERRFCDKLARDARLPVVHVHYRLAPEHPFPAGLDDCVAVYAGLLADGIPANKIVLIGHSAGANYTVSTLMRARRAGLPQPAGAIMLGAPLDMTASSPSASANADKDSMMGPGVWPFVRQHWLVSTPPDHPDASPLFNDWNGLASLHFHVSDNEIVLDDSRRAVEHARGAGVDADLTVWHDMPHSFYYFDVLKESRQCRAQMLGFIAARLGRGGRPPDGTDAA
jgi:monoterpene epsilon-lactone hydrolase